MTKRARVGLLVVLILLVVLFLVVRLKKNDDNLPISAPIPPSSVPTTSSDLAQLQLRLAPVASVANPTAFAVRGGDTSLYVTEQEGRIRRIRRNGDGFTLDDQPVLDIADEVTAAGEQGLLGLAFAPDGRTLYFAFTNRNEDQQLDEIAFDGDHADDIEATHAADHPRLRAEPQRRRPRRRPRRLPVLGDGRRRRRRAIHAGRARTRRTCSATSFASIQPIRERTAVPTPSRPTIPSPTASTVHPRCGSTGCAIRGGSRSTVPRKDLWIADVGQSAIEEIDFVPAGTPAGQNFGWSDVEGTHPYRSAQPPSGAVAPIYEYDHSGGRCSITGGYVYRGSDIPGLQGTYLFADYCDGKINGLVRAPDGSVTVTDLRLAAGGLTSFGEDADGELYVLSAQNGVERIESVGTTRAPPTSSQE